MHQADGRPISFRRQMVMLIEPHPSGTGTLVVLGLDDYPRELHLSANYSEVRREVTMSDMERALRCLQEPSDTEAADATYTS